MTLFRFTGTLNSTLLTKSYAFFMSTNSWCTALTCGHAVAHLVEALCYEPEGRGFDYRWCHWIFFHWQDPAGRTMALGSTQPQQKWVPGMFPRGKDGRCVGLTTYHLHVPTVLKSGSLNLPETSGPVQACNGIAFYCPTVFPFFLKYLNGEYRNSIWSFTPKATLITSSNFACTWS
jgi:hypothetical protein